MTAMFGTMSRRPLGEQSSPPGREDGLSCVAFSTIKHMPKMSAAPLNQQIEECTCPQRPDAQTAPRRATDDIHLRLPRRFSRRKTTGIFWMSQAIGFRWVHRVTNPCSGCDLSHRKPNKRFLANTHQTQPRLDLTYYLTLLLLLLRRTTPILYLLRHLTPPPLQYPDDLDHRGKESFPLKGPSRSYSAIPHIPLPDGTSSPASVSG
ncbi:hypothetical protein BZA05DRAFT_244891 [Tricharina praecox]|uniref:uncharacterized protein n=1 Tax=Tricharina praecox TaxID=43433 RepID=UPI00221FFCED|nr:uncharacterized protein BZA05DRAFT_244891 [Tricharina praecox]KAI5854573.1 hypothetical protein BZA05DRAFT_244891 [Tricharina praecox]